MPPTASEWQGRVALVTGAGGALGQAVAGALFAADALVAVTDRREDRLAELYGLWPEERVVRHAAALDEPVPVAGLIAAVEAKFGRLDMVAHCAGGFRGGAPAWKTAVEDFDALWASNARSVFLVARAAASLMVRLSTGSGSGSGSIVVVAAGSALAGTAGLSAYAASKAAALRVVESLAAEGAAHGVRVNAVLPGTMDTPANRAAMPDADVSRWTAIEAMVEAILFLGSERSRGVTGVGLPVMAGQGRSSAGN